MEMIRVLIYLAAAAHRHSLWCLRGELLVPDGLMLQKQKSPPG